MPVKWGIGIEHETLILFPEDQQELVNGKYILDTLLRNNKGLDRYIKDIIQKNKKYRLYRVYNDYDLSNIYEYSMDEFKDFINKNGNKLLLEAYLSLIESMSPDLVIQDWKDYKHFYGEAGENYYYNEMTGEVLYDDLALYSNKELDLREVVTKVILPSIHDDATTTYGVSEFTTPFSYSLYRNNKIYQVVFETVLKQMIIKRLLEYQSGYKLEYPKIGTIFPIMVEGSTILNKRGITIDYSGSYHINLSLPYNESLLESEKLQYEKYRNKVEHIVTPADTRNMGISFKNYEKTVYDIESKILNYIQDSGLPKDYRLDRILGKASINLSIINKIILGKFPYQRICFKVNNYGNINISVYIIYEGNMSYLTSYTYQDKLTPSDDENIRHYFKKIIDNKTYLAAKHNYLYDSPTSLLAIPNDYGSTHDGIDPRISFSEIEKLRETFRNNKIDLARRPDKKLVDYIKQGVLDGFYYIMNYTYSNLNLYNNSYFIDKISNFHKIHKIWAVCIQWIMPLILSAYSSCDPLSVGDSNKLTQLSLRSFISGYSFIDITDILDYGLPIKREMYSYQDESNIIPYLKTKFPYWKNRFKVSGSEFRSDTMRGFDFGFELRIFDNFDSEHLNKLIELLVLLADHIDREKIGDNIDNPFNNRVLNEVVEKVVYKGWITKIDKPYIDVLNKNLKLDLQYSDDLIAYDLINNIYSKMINNCITSDIDSAYGKYMISDDLKKHFSKYLDNDKLKQKFYLPNINRKSWEQSFNHLIYIPNKWNIRNKTKGLHQDDLKYVLGRILPEKYKGNILDIYYFINNI